MKVTVLTVLIASIVSCGTKNQNPPDFQSKLIGEWARIGDRRPVMIIHQLTDSGMFTHDSLGQRWHGHSAWLSGSKDTLFGRQGCTMHYKIKVSYISKGNRIVINDTNNTIVPQHINMSPR